MTANRGNGRDKHPLTNEGMDRSTCIITVSKLEILTNPWFWKEILHVM